MTGMVILLRSLPMQFFRMAQMLTSLREIIVAGSSVLWVIRYGADE